MEEQNKSQTGNSVNSDIDYKGLIKKIVEKIYSKNKAIFSTIIY